MYSAPVPQSAFNGGVQYSTKPRNHRKGRKRRSVTPDELLESIRTSIDGTLDQLVAKAAVSSLPTDDLPERPTGTPGIDQSTIAALQQSIQRQNSVLACVAGLDVPVRSSVHYAGLTLHMRAQLKAQQRRARPPASDARDLLAKLKRDMKRDMGKQPRQLLTPRVTAAVEAFVQSLNKIVELSGPHTRLPGKKLQHYRNVTQAFAGAFAGLRQLPNIDTLLLDVKRQQEEAHAR